MSASTLTALPVGQKSQNSALAALLGSEIEVSSALLGLGTSAPGTTRLKLVKASADIASSDGRALTWTSAALNTVGAVAGAVAVSATVAGVAYVTPSGATGVSSGDYFWVVVNGPAPAVGSAAFSAQVLLATAASGAVSGTLTATDGSTVIGRSLLALGAGGAVVIFVKIN